MNNYKLDESRHFSPAIKEWSNSVYSFNRSNERDIFYKDQVCNRLITNYFNINKKPLSRSKSKRMRDLISKSTTKQIITSRPYIKQNNDNVNITVYIYDRQRKNNNKRLYFLRNKLNSILKMRKLEQDINNIYMKKKFSSKFISRGSFNYKKLKKSVSNYKINFMNYSNLLIKSIFNKKNYINNIFLFYFIRWTFSIMGLHLNIVKTNNKKFNKIILSSKDRLIINKSLRNTGKYKKIIDISNNNKLGYVKLLDFYVSNNKSDSIKNMNILLIKYICVLYNKYYNYIPNLTYLFLIFKKKFFRKFGLKYFYKEYVSVRYLFKIYLNKLKTGKLLYGLKYLISNIYNKKIVFNIINLKYLSMNSDIFIKGIRTKLRNRKSAYRNLIRRSLKLVKIPTNNLLSKIGAIVRDNSKNIETVLLSKSNLFNESNVFKGLKINNLYSPLNKLYVNNTDFLSNDKLNIILTNLFGNNIVDNKVDSYVNTLNSLKYKWTTGIRIEAKGRLTKRYAAERSKSIFKYKGNLKNKDYIEVLAKQRLINANSKHMHKPTGAYNLRNEIRTNIDYGFISSKKHVGTFGLKAWISTN